MGSATTKLRNIHLTLGGNYAYTWSVNQEGLNKFDQSIGKQLPYVPFHRGTVYLHADYHQWHGQVNTHYTGYRYTSTDNEDFLEGFTLVNTSLARKIKLGQSMASVSFQIRNLFDVQYQNLALRAMPGRSYHFSLRYHFSTQSQP
jgi:iron complex outermembrane receptor protein